MTVATFVEIVSTVPLIAANPDAPFASAYVSPVCAVPMVQSASFLPIEPTVDIPDVSAFQMTESLILLA